MLLERNAIDSIAFFSQCTNKFPQFFIKNWPFVSTNASTSNRCVSAADFFKLKK